MADNPRRAVIADRVKATLKEKRITLRDLHGYTGLAERTLARRLTGRVDWQLDELDLIADALGIDLLDLLATS